MAVTILRQATVSATPGSSAYIEVVAAIPNGGSFLRYLVAPIPINTPDVQAYLNANESTYLASALANNALSMTQKQVNVGDFAWQHWANRDVFAIAHYTYTVGMLGGAATLAAYRTVLTNAFAELSPLSGSQFDTELTNERIALGVNIAISTMTLAQCQAFATLLDRWLSARQVDSLWSGIILGLQ